MTMRQVSEMVSHQNPVTLPPSATVQHACACMRDRRVGAVLVTEGGRQLVGIFTGRDAVSRVLAEGRDAAETPLEQVMTRNPDTMPPGQTAIEALRLMQDGGYRHLPVVMRGKVVGIVSRGDFRGLEEARLDEETGLWERI
jgi:CBS domain-containing protein